MSEDGTLLDCCANDDGLLGAIGGGLSLGVSERGGGGKLNAGSSLGMLKAAGEEVLEVDMIAVTPLLDEGGAGRGV
jgi:hypothetical protein